MKTFAALMLVTAGIYTAATAQLTAGELPWRAGEQRQVGYGHCAKGACVRRTCWAPSKPHRHVRGRIVVSKIGTKNCWRLRHSRR